ncbi:MAG TPA: helix-turn-helix transcriptional regulator [Selenomonadales bacterium]|nr:helix-turn-helix transcriptional regulator [Selenomonadales bacterium]
MKLAALRKAKKWTQEKLEAESKVSQGHISALERGIKQPTLPVLKRLAAALGVSIVDLLDEADAGPLQGKNISNYRSTACCRKADA